MLDFEWVGKQGCGGSRGSANGVKVTCVKGGRGQVAQTTVRLGVDVMKACRFLVGDRALIGFANEGGKKYMAVRRDTTGQGYMMSNPGGSKVHGTSNASGIIKTKVLRVNACDVPLKDCLIDDAGVLIVPVGEA